MKYLVETAHAVNGEKILLAIFDSIQPALEYANEIKNQLEEIEREYDICRAGELNWNDYVDTYGLLDDYKQKVYWSEPVVRKFENRPL